MQMLDIWNYSLLQFTVVHSCYLLVFRLVSGLTVAGWVAPCSRGRNLHCVCTAWEMLLYNGVDDEFEKLLKLWNGQPSLASAPVFWGKYVIQIH